MKIAFVSDAIYPYNKGGKEKRLYDISTRLAQMGHEVHIYCMKWWKGSEKNRIENGVHLHAISPYYPLYSGERRSIKEGVLFGLACLKLIREDWDVIDVDHMPFFPIIFTKIVCVLKGKKMIATWNEVWGLKYWKEYLGWKGYIAYFIEKISINCPNKIISISEGTTSRLKKEFIMNIQLKTIPVGLNYKDILEAKPSKEQFDVMYAGRLLQHKNLDYLIRAIAQIKKTVPTISCLIVGNGPEKKDLIQLSHELKLTKNIIFKDFFEEHKTLYSFMKSTKVFVYPSSREGFGIAPIEAHVAGAQVITVDEKDNFSKNIVKDFGSVIHLDVESLAEEVMKLVKKPSPKLIEKYSWDKILPLLDYEYTQ